MKTPKLVAEICLYGTQAIGAGWLARTADGSLLGNGGPRPGHTFTDALWLACEAVRQTGVKRGKIRVFAHGGERMAETDLGRVGYFGNLIWVPAVAYVIAANDVIMVAK